MIRLHTSFLTSVLALSVLAGLNACGGGGGDDSVLPAAAQTISFASPGSQTFGVATADLIATSTSRLTVAFASSTPSVCGVSGARLTLVGAGACTVTATQSGSSAFLPATAVSNTFTVVAGTQTVSFVSPGNQTLGTAPAALMATASSGLPVTFSSNTSGVCTVTGNTLTLLAAGTCTVSAAQAGNANFAPAAEVANTVTIAAMPLLPQTISFAALGAQTLGAAASTLAATSTSNLPVSFASTTPATCTVSDSTLTLVGVGSCTVVASQAGNSAFAGAANVTNSFSVAATAQTITFNQPINVSLSVGSTSLLATASSGLSVAFASTTAAVCTVSGTTLTLVSAGTCNITASQAGNASFAVAAPVSRSLTVTAAVLPTQTITFTSPGNQILGTPPGALVASASSGLSVTFDSATPSVCSVSGTTLTLRSVGTCTVNASQAGNANFAAAVLTRSVVVDGIELFANGGFETVGVTTPANAWLQAAAGYTRSTDSRSGAFAAQLASPASNAAILLQNSVDQGMRPALVVGTAPVLTFWAKGTAGATGSLTYALRFLDGIGNILYTSTNQNFGAAINTTTYTKITFTAGTVPVGATAAFIEFSQAIGPIGTGPAGENWFAGRVLIDDLSLMVLTLP